MTSTRIATLVAWLVLGAAPAFAQAVLRPAPSGRATSEVSLSVPRVAPGMAGMAGMGTPAATGAPVPAPSPAEKPLLIRLDYGQPHLRGRALHTDSLVPYDKPWRTGASGATMLSTDVDLVIGGASLAKGTYVLYTIPGRTKWTLVLQKNVGQSAMQYDGVNDVMRIDLRYAALSTPMEAFTMWLVPSLAPGAAKGELRFAWGTDQLSTDWSVK